MSVAKVIEILAEGDTIEAAVESAVNDVSKTVKNIKHVYVKDFQGLVENNKVVRYRVNAKVTFVVGERQ